MPRELILPASLMTLAFAAYTAGVWGERLRHDLLGRHVGAFWLGLACDAAATRLMSAMVRAGVESPLVHTLTGASAFALMLGHALWATWVLVRGSSEARGGFHRYSLIVWMVWLVPYLGGMAAGMTRGFAGT